MFRVVRGRQRPLFGGSIGLWSSERVASRCSIRRRLLMAMFRVVCNRQRRLIGTLIGLRPSRQRCGKGVPRPWQRRQHISRRLMVAVELAAVAYFLEAQRSFCA